MFGFGSFNKQNMTSWLLSTFQNFIFYFNMDKKISANIIISIDIKTVVMLNCWYLTISSKIFGAWSHMKEPCGTQSSLEIGDPQIGHQLWYSQIVERNRPSLSKD